MLKAIQMWILSDWMHAREEEVAAVAVVVEEAEAEDPHTTTTTTPTPLLSQWNDFSHN